MLVMYLAGVVGFDIHVDHHDHHAYVVSLLSKIDCEDIHPEEHCHCCDHHHGDCDADDEDCENFVEHLEITGCDDDSHADLVPMVAVQVMPVVASVNIIPEFCSEPTDVDDFALQPRELLSQNCVLRV